MNKHFHLPLYTFLKIVFHNGRINFKKIKNSSSWFVITTLFEQVPRIELNACKQKIKKYKRLMHPLFVAGYYRNDTSYFTPDNYQKLQLSKCVIKI